MKNTKINHQLYSEVKTALVVSSDQQPKRIARLFCIFTLLLFLSITSCKKFVDVGPSTKELSPELVFSNDASATTAVIGIYTDLWTMGYEIARTTGRSSDELANFISELNQQQFFTNELRTDNTIIEAIWRALYKALYGANAVIEGLSNSTGMSNATKTQLEGEARFLRAFCYFNLINLFGDVPLITSTDYRINAVAPRTSVSVVYDLIIADLIDAQGKLAANYSFSNNERVRASKGAATALLARVYLYTGNWVNAEAQATAVINNTAIYTLQTDLSKVFLASSTSNTNKEVILQFYPVSNTLNTSEGNGFILTTTPPPNVALRSDFVIGFETNDLRRTNWVGQITGSSGTYYYPFKYKIRSNAVKTEYSMVLRLAEQYLIRAEARAQQNKLVGANTAESDINIIRSRANLPSTTGATQAQLLAAIEKERKVELFTEWGHRWFDLKRTNRATAVLGPLKTGWQSTDQLYPIPLREMNTNYTLTQNQGY